MPDTPTDTRRDVALFRYGVIAELLSLPPGSPELKAALAEKVQRRYTIPGSRRTRVARETIRDWLVLGITLIRDNWVVLNRTIPSGIGCEGGTARQGTPAL